MKANGYRDYFKVLEVERGADAEAIKRSFRKLARQYHPDVNPGDQAAEARFKEISEAYEVLSDPDKRRRYEQFGQYWNQMGGPGAGGGAEEDLVQLLVLHTFHEISDRLRLVARRLVVRRDAEFPAAFELVPVALGTVRCPDIRRFRDGYGRLLLRLEFRHRRFAHARAALVCGR